MLVASAILMATWLIRMALAIVMLTLVSRRFRLLSWPMMLRWAMLILWPMMLIVPGSLMLALVRMGWATVLLHRSTVMPINDHWPVVYHRSGLHIDRLMTMGWRRVIAHAGSMMYHRRIVALVTWFR
ncbi:MAG: hypothetical protein CVV16_03270 [Gammaproteobacteria bacterium HGW-Gammaproteobacteria-6]|nr:MAG: hypothetical protein CVV16_03270 [Gammaproteobacteria bacterium HGW-Gammaproteobacteria-6]